MGHTRSITLLSGLTLSLLLQASACAAPSVDSILAAYTKACGGKAALEKLHSRIMRARMEIPSMNSTNTLEIYAKAPNKQASRIDLGTLGVITEGFDGKVAWTKNPFEGLRVKTGDELAKVQKDSMFHRVTNMKAVYSDLAYKGTQKGQAEDLQVLEAKPTPTSLERFFFGARSGQLLRQESTLETPGGKLVSAIDLQNYHAVDGIQYPHTIKVQAKTPEMDMVSTLRVLEIKHNENIPDEKFSKPAQ